MQGELTVNDDVAVIVRAIADIPATRGTYIVLENCSRIGIVLNWGTICD